MSIHNYKKLFFENIGVKQTIFKNTFWLIVAEVISRLSAFILIIFAARILGAKEYGKFTFALSFVLIAVVLSDLGLINITTRELSREKEKEKEYSAILSLKTILSIGAWLIMVIGSFFLTKDPTVRETIWILGTFILITSFLNIIYAFLRARQKMEYEGGIKIFQSLAITAVGISILFTMPSIKNLSWGYFLTNLIVLIVILLFFHSRFYPLKIVYNPHLWRKLLKMSWPLSLGFLFSWIYLAIDSAMMGYFGQIFQTGWYNAAAKIALSTTALASLVSRSFYPVLSKFFHASKTQLQKAWDDHLKVMIILAIPLTIGGMGLAPKIIDFFYGSSYSPSVFSFQLLILVTGLSFLYYPYSMVLIVSDQERKNLTLILIGAGINIILNLILIPQYTLYGAAISTIIAGFIVLLLGASFSWYFTAISPFNLKLFRVLIIALLAGGVMLFCLKQFFIYNLHVLLSALIGGVIYFLIFIGGWRFLLR